MIIEGNFGWWCESNNAKKFKETLNECLVGEAFKLLGDNSFKYLQSHYSTVESYNTIIRNGQTM